MKFTDIDLKRIEAKLVSGIYGPEFIDWVYIDKFGNKTERIEHPKKVREMLNAYNREDLISILDQLLEHEKGL